MTQFSDTLRNGLGEGRGTRSGVRGIDMVRAYRYRITPTTIDADAVANSQTAAAAGNLTINGAKASMGVATLDVPRGVSILSNDDDSGTTFTVYGGDVYGVDMTEELAGPTTNATVVTTKAFKTVTNVAVSTTSAGAISVGDSDVFGLPFRVDGFADTVINWNNALITANTGFVAADASVANETTGDVRGTYAVQSASNNAKVLSVLVMPVDCDTSNGLVGVNQA